MPAVDVNGEALHFIEKGSGPAVVLLHGIGARSELWNDVADELSDSHSVWAFDLHGHGQSTCNQALSVGTMAVDVLAATEKMQLKSFHLVGVSLGGAVAVQMAAAAPEKVQSLLISGVGLDIAKVLADEIYGIREAVHYLLPADFAEQVSRDLLSPDTADDRAQALAASIQSLTKQRYLQALEVLAATDLRTAATQIKAPTLVLHGEFDELIAAKAADALAAAAANAQRKELTNAGHLANIDNPAAFAAAVSSFVGGRQSP